MGKEQFVGSWRLISSQYVSEDGEVIYPMGQHVIGRLMYDDKGYMSVQHMSANRLAFASDDLMGGTASEIKKAFESSRAYYGTYDIDWKKNVIVHHVEGHSVPNGMGRDNVRTFQFSDNRLILTTTPMLMGGKYRVGQLVWERLE